MKKYLKMIGKIIIYLAIYMVSSILTFNVLSMLISNNETRMWINNNPSMILIISNIVTIVLLYLAFKIMKKDLFKFCRFTKFDKRFIPFFITIGASLGIFSTAVVRTNLVQEQFSGLVTALNNIVNGDIAIVVFLGTIIMGSIVEELLFRGLVLNELKKNMPVAVAILIQGLMFGFILGDIPVAIYASLGAIIFSMIYLWTGSLWSAIITHMISSASIYIFTKVFSNVIKGGSIPYFIIISLVVIIVSLAFMWKYKENFIVEENDKNSVTI